MKHDLIQKLKEVASEIGRTPQRDEYASKYGFAYKSVFGGWAQFVQAAGLDPVRYKPKDPYLIDSPEIIKKITAENSVRREVRLNHYKKILAIPDTHFCFAHMPSVQKVIEIAHKEKPDVIVQLGDLMDLYAFSRFPRSLNVYTPKAELELSRAQSENFWEELRKASPKADCFQLLGNHLDRINKQTINKLPEAESLISNSIKELFTFDGVLTIHDPTEELVISDIRVIHGYLSGLGRHRDYNATNIICGHTHRGGVDYRSYGDKTLFELNAGFLADPYSKALSYRPQKIHNWTLGCGFVDQYGPRFIAF